MLANWLQKSQKLSDITNLYGKIVEICKSEHSIPHSNEGAIKNGHEINYAHLFRKGLCESSSETSTMLKRSMK
jgi:hypothetical protein